MMKFAILGSGFGLYGYLPALVLSGQTVILPKRYQERFNHRKELEQFKDHVKWESDENSALDVADGVLLALNPLQQMHWLPICLKKKKINKLLLEKPLASSPVKARKSLHQLQKSNLQFRIGYLFRDTSWGQALRTQLKNNLSIKELNIEWHFMAHHFLHNIQTWKRFHDSGGGVIRFYAIHLIALLAELGYKKIVSSEVVKSDLDSDNKYIKWQGTFTGKNLPLCHITVDTHALHNSFCINQTSLVDHQALCIVNLSDPFQTDDLFSTQLDKRIPLLTNLCKSLLNSTENYFDWYFSTIELWYEVEKNMRFV